MRSVVAFEMMREEVTLTGKMLGLISGDARAFRTRLSQIPNLAQRTGCLVSSDVGQLLVNLKRGLVERIFRRW